MTARQVTSVVWHSVQALAECLISRMSFRQFPLVCRPIVISSIVFLVRTLMKSRSGIHKSDAVVNYLVRSVIQTGCLATIWAIAALISWFYVRNNFTFRIFDITSGAVYTHVSIFSCMQFPRLNEAHLRLFSIPLFHASGCVRTW